MMDIQGRCIACDGTALCVGAGGNITCSRVDCPRPSAVDELLHGQETGLVQLLGGNRGAQLVAHTLTVHGHSPADVQRMTDEQLLAVPGIGETSLARIRRAFPAPEPPSRSVSVEEVVRLEGALHLLRFALDRFAAAKFAPAPEYLRDLLDRATADPGEPCDREQQYTRAEAAEATIDRVREASAHIRATTRTWEPVADLIDAALDDAKRPRERRERPAHPDGTPYRYHEITAGGWGHCDGCRTWTTATTERPHECPKTYMKGPAAEEGRHEP